MEITKEIKAKVFAQYLGQYVNSSKGICVLRDMDFIDSLDWIQLKPLSVITDEHAKELAELKGNENPLYIIASFRGQPEYKKGPDQRIINWFLEQTKFYQFLQSKGYDLPNFYLGGKTLQEAGLATYE